VAKVVRDAESVEIFVSAANEKLGSLITRAQRRGVSAVDAIKDFYLEHIAFHAFLESTAQEATTATQESDDENGGAKPERNSELARACETICGIAEATFDVLVTGAVDPTSQTSQDAPSSEPTGAVSA
jgi:hypothetical protein